MKKKNILPTFFTEKLSRFFIYPHHHLPDNYLENMHPRQFYGFGFKECLDERIRI